MTPDIEQIRAELKHARLTKDRIDRAEACMSWAEEYGPALLAAIDELTAENISLDAYVTQVQTIMQAQVDELTAQLRALQSWAGGARTDLAELTAQRDAVLALHYEVNAHDCAECGDPWPCETVRALT